MERRTFMEIMGGSVMSSAASGSAAAGQKTKLYILHQFFLKNGMQLGRMHDYFGKTLLPSLAGLHKGPTIVMQALVAPHMPQIAVIAGYQSMDEFFALRSKLEQTEAYRKGLENWEKGSEPPTEHYTSSLLAATDYSPEIEPLANPPKTPRIFELRTYHSPTQWQLRALHERFAGPEIKIFHRVGVHPLLYTETIFGPHKPNLTYLIPFDNLAEREKAWAKFGADPEWHKVRQESIDKAGQISSVIQISLYTPTDYSPIR
jgi:NIPSNAP